MWAIRKATSSRAGEGMEKYLTINHTVSEICLAG